MKHDVGTGVADVSIQNEIYDIVNSHGKTEYRRIIEEKAGYPYVYHLADIRANLINWLPVKQTDAVLELGAECGALTETLAEMSDDVTFWTDTRLQAEIIRCRLQKNVSGADCKKITALTGAWDEIAGGLLTYDVIVLAGGFGEAAKWLPENGTNPYVELLKTLRAHLKPGGFLAIADANRLGLKYFAGCQEEHLGGYFLGPEGYPGVEKYRTFTKKEWEKMLSEAGYEGWEFHYPYPDYKLPVTVYSDEYLPLTGELIENHRNMDRDRYVFFDEAKVYDTLLEEGLFTEFSNSFLILAGQRAVETVYTRYSNERAAKFQVRTDIVAKPDGEKAVYKYALQKDGEAHIRHIARVAQELKENFTCPDILFCPCKEDGARAVSPFLQGKTLQQEMEDLLAGKQEYQVAELVNRYLTWITEDGGNVPFAMTEEFKEVFGEVRLPEHLNCAKVSDIDLIFSNILTDEGKWQVIDYEWTFEFPIPKNFVIYRACFLAYHQITKCSALDFDRLMKQTGITEEEIRCYEQMEQHFQEYIRGGVYPIRDMKKKIKTKEISFEELKELEKNQGLNCMNPGKTSNSMIKKIAYNIDRLEYNMGTVICCGWAYAVDENGAYHPTEITLKATDGESVGETLTRTMRPDVAEAQKIDVEEPYWGFNFVWNAGKDKTYQLIFSCGTKEEIHEITYEYFARKIRENERRYPNAAAMRSCRDEKTKEDDRFYRKTYGIRELYRIRKRRLNPKNVPYAAWRRFQLPDEKEIEKQEKQEFPFQPKISIIVPAYRTPEKFLREMIESVQKQTYGNWELCIADGSMDHSIDGILEEYQKKDSRVKYKLLDGNYGISGNTNEALSLADGDYIGLLDHDDILEVDTLYEVVKAINEKDADIIYTDEDKVSLDLEEYFDPHFKPDYNPDYLKSCNYICHFFTAKKEIVEKVVGFDSSCDGSQDYDFILRCIRNASQVVHIPKILYHWRCHPNSTAMNPESKLYCYEAGKRAIGLDLKAGGMERAEVKMGRYYGMYEVYYPLEKEPLVSIITTQKEAIEELLRGMTYQNYEVIETGSDRFVPEELNKASQKASGEIILYLSSAKGAEKDNWLHVLAANVMREEVAAAGPKLLNTDGNVLSAGLVVGLYGTASGLFVGHEKDSNGYFNHAITQQCVSAIAVNGMAIKKERFLKTNGWNEKLTAAQAGIQLCLELQKNGDYVIFSPYAELYVDETADSPHQILIEDEEFQRQYGEMIKWDPYYNRNFDRNGEEFTLAYD